MKCSQFCGEKYTKHTILQSHIAAHSNKALLTQKDSGSIQACIISCFHSPLSFPQLRCPLHCPVNKTKKLVHKINKQINNQRRTHSCSCCCCACTSESVFSKTANLMRFKQRIKTGCHSSIMIHSYVLNRLRNDRDIQNEQWRETVKSVLLHHRIQLICDSASLIHDQPM